MSNERPHLNPFLVTAVDAVRRAGEIQLEHLGSELRITQKTGTDIVTQADLDVEDMFRRMIAERFPDHTVVAEERGETRGRQPSHRWLFDPIDGTVNFSRGLPFFCASVA